MPSRRSQARLPAITPTKVVKTGLFVDDDDARIAAILAVVPLDLLQLHGSETPDRVAAIKAKFGLPVMKVIKVRDAADIARARDYETVADRLLFDAAATRQHEKRHARRQCGQLRLDPAQGLQLAACPGCCPGASPSRTWREAVSHERGAGGRCLLRGRGSARARKVPAKSRPSWSVARSL